VKKAAALKQSDELVAQGRFVDALRQFAPRAADFPEDDVVQMTLGRLLAQTGDLAGGETAFRRAIELAPHKIQSHYYLSYFLVAKGTNLAESGNPSKAEAAFKEAETCARRALGLKPDYGFAYNSLGLALKKQKRFEEAEKAMREAVRCIPDMAEIRIDLADILADENRPADAIEQYEQALKLAPPDASWRPEVEKKRDALRKGK
jgi:tetratricopeptide (TPR) repeat protein